MNDEVSKKLKDISGQRYGRLVALSISHRKGYRTYWLCQCDCGNTTNVYLGKLTTGSTKSCGCLKIEVQQNGSITHGMAGTKVYNTWARMKARCYDKNNPKYNEWGGRGVTICDEWLHDFETFYEYVGNEPSKSHQIDRINNNKNYEPGNVHWVTGTENARNKRNSKWWFVDGVWYESVYHAAEVLGIKYGTIFKWCSNNKNGCHSELKYPAA